MTAAGWRGAFVVVQQGESVIVPSAATSYQSGEAFEPVSMKSRPPGWLTRPVPGRLRPAPSTNTSGSARSNRGRSPVRVSRDFRAHNHLRWAQTYVARRRPFHDFAYSIANVRSGALVWPERRLR